MELLGAGATVVVALISAAWGLLTLSARQFKAQLDERFALQEKARVEAATRWEKSFKELTDLRNVEREQILNVERSLMNLRAELPREYMRREDHVRFETVITARLDALYSEIKFLGARMGQTGDNK